jgi:hypothetical protein
MTKRFYRITVRGRLGDRFVDAFEPLHVEIENGNTVLAGVCVDMSALYGILDHVRDLGLDLWEVRSFAIAPEAAAG